MSSEHPRASAALVALGVIVALAFLPAAQAPRAPAPAAVGSGVTLLNDGSTADTGPQPGQPASSRLKPGERPPQFVVFSFDDPVEDDNRLFSQARSAAKNAGAKATFFLRGIDLLPVAQRTQYQPPQHDPGTAAVAFPADDARIRATLQQLGQAWLDGDEIADGFIGQFCGAKGAQDWSTAEWESEIDQGNSLVNFWKTRTGFGDLPPLPFDYQSELTGGRAPCLEGRANLLPAEQDFGWRYDASLLGVGAQWPERTDGIWEFPLSLPADQTPETYRAAFSRRYQGSRAPLVIDTRLDPQHPDRVRSTAQTMKELCGLDGVRCVSFRELADWLDAQDPAVLEQLRRTSSS